MIKVFLSHSPRDKAHVGAIRSYLPKYISAWIDEYELLLDTADINAPIRKAIPDKADFVIIYLSREAIKPEWVRRESECALEREKFLTNNS